MKPFYLKVVATDKVFFDGMCVSLVIPIDDGLMGILADHENTAMVIDAGEIKIKTEDGKENYGFISDGFLEVVGGEATIVAISAEKPEDIDDVRANAALERAKDELSHKQNEREHEHSLASMARAIGRLKLKDKYNKPM